MILRIITERAGPTGVLYDEQREPTREEVLEWLRAHPEPPLTDVDGFRLEVPVLVVHARRSPTDGLVHRVALAFPGESDLDRVFRLGGPDGAWRPPSGALVLLDDLAVEIDCLDTFGGGSAMAWLANGIAMETVRLATRLRVR
jgi:hypothetical protein